MPANTPSWTAWLADGFTRSAEPLIADGYLAPGFHELAGEVLAALEPLLATRPGALIHGDLGDGEIYADHETATITGLVDWGASVVGDPLYEFARFVAGGPAGPASRGSTGSSRCARKGPAC